MAKIQIQRNAPFRLRLRPTIGGAAIDNSEYTYTSKMRDDPLAIAEGLGVIPGNAIDLTIVPDATDPELVEISLTEVQTATLTVTRLLRTNRLPKLDIRLNPNGAGDDIVTPKGGIPVEILDVQTYA